MCRLLAGESWERSVKPYRIVDDVVARLVILVPGPLPMGHDDVRFVLADQIANSELHFFIVGNLAIGVGKKLSARAEHLRRAFRRLLLKDAILWRSNLSRAPPAEGGR